MKEQQETNNASPAAAVNLQMWPSAPQEEGKEEWEAGRSSSSAFTLPSTKPAPDLSPSNQGPCLPDSLLLPQLRASWPPLSPLGLFCMQC